jgi:hypothetical protein
MVAAMTDQPPTHNPLHGVTAGVWKRGSVVHKVLTRRRPAPPHASGLPERLGLGAPRLWTWWSRRMVTSSCGWITWKGDTRPA